MTRSARRLAVFLAFFLAATSVSAAPADSGKALFAALQADDVSSLAAALDAGASLEIRDETDSTLLLRGIAEHRAKSVPLLIARGADIQARDGNQYGAFDLAIERDNLGAAVLLLEQWTKAPAIDAQRAASRLALAAAQGRLDDVRKSLDAGVAADALGTSGYTALALAARWGRTDIVDVLLARGAAADLATRSRYNSTPLMEASRDGHVDIAERLIARGAQVNTADRYGDHSLNWAAYFGHAPFVAVLLKAGPDLKRTGQTDDWPIEIAIREGHTAVVDLLTKAGAAPRPGKDKASAPKQ